MGRRGLVTLALLLGATAFGNERRFSYTYESATLPEGERELEIWNTARLKRDTFFAEWDNRMEFEVGITDRLQTSLYLNSHMVSAPTGPNGETDTGFTFDGISNEWKYKLMDPVADPIGLAVYGELALGPQVAELEAKVIFDKRIGRNLFAFNLVGAHEWEIAPQQTEREIELEADLAYAFFVTDRFTVGAEVWQHNVISNLQGYEFSALSLGPVVSYVRKNFWVTLTFMPQLPALKTPEGSTTPYVLTDHERVQTRLLVSFLL